MLERVQAVRRGVTSQAGANERSADQVPDGIVVIDDEDIFGQVVRHHRAAEPSYASLCTIANTFRGSARSMRHRRGIESFNEPERLCLQIVETGEKTWRVI